jgi:hypothetical protein
LACFKLHVEHSLVNATHAHIQIALRRHSPPRIDYSPTYIFLTSESESEIEFNISFILYLSASHLGNVRIQYDYEPFFDYYGPRYERSSLDISMLTALSTASPNLEVLEIGFVRQFKVYSVRYHPVFEIREYSWVDEPVELPFGGV